MNVGSNDVRAPDQDVLRLVDGLGIGSDRSAYRITHAEHACCGADRSIQQGCSEAMKESPIHASTLEQTHRTCIAVGQNRLRIFLCDRLQPGGDRFKGFVP